MAYVQAGIYVEINFGQYLKQILLIKYKCSGISVYVIELEFDLKQLW